MAPLKALNPMLKFIFNTIVLAVLSTALAFTPVQLNAQSTNKAPTAKPAAKKSRSIPFSGTVTAIDKSAKTLKVDKRVLQITSETKIQKADKPTMLETGAVGDYVTGSYQKAEDGRLLAHSIYFGGKTKTSSSETKK
jgi:Cu/Ag efflux protein CusF